MTRLSANLCKRISFLRSKGPRGLLIPPSSSAPASPPWRPTRASSSAGIFGSLTGCEDEPTPLDCRAKYQLGFGPLARATAKVQGLVSLGQQLQRQELGQSEYVYHLRRIPVLQFWLRRLVLAGVIVAARGVCTDC